MPGRAEEDLFVVPDDLFLCLPSHLVLLLLLLQEEGERGSQGGRQGQGRSEQCRAGGSFFHFTAGRASHRTSEPGGLR